MSQLYNSWCSFHPDFLKSSFLFFSFLFLSSPTLAHPHLGGECSSSRGRRAFHAGDDGAVQPAAERAAASQSHSDRLTSILWQSCADRRPSTVWHRPVQKFHRGEWALPGFKWALNCPPVCFSQESHSLFQGILKRALPLS